MSKAAMPRSVAPAVGGCKGRVRGKGVSGECEWQVGTQNCPLPTMARRSPPRRTKAAANCPLKTSG